jgi:RNA polymerase sigma-70 factor, ECF subfamily
MRPVPHGQNNPADSERQVGDLLAAAVQGGPAAETAWREIIRLYGRRVYALARSRCRRDDMAEEITQSVFATVASKLGGGGEGGYTEQGRFEAWLFRIAMNRIRDEMRRQRRHADVSDPASFRNIEGADDAAGTDEEVLEMLRLAMERLPDQDREIIELRHHGGMSFRAMAELLEEPLGTLLARHHRALRKLKQMMEPQRRLVAPAPPGKRAP